MSTLFLDSSSGYATAMVIRDDAVLAVHSVRGRTLALLHELAHRVLADVADARGEVDEIAVVSGPGSWTGLHVGLTAAKTLAQVWELPLVAVSMLEALAGSLTAPGTRPLVPLIDARRGAFYCGVYRRAEGALLEVAPGAKRQPAEVAKLLADATGPALLVGSGAHAALPALAADLDEAPEPVDLHYPHPEAFAALVAARRHDALTGDARYALTPDYMGEDFTITPGSFTAS